MAFGTNGQRWQNATIPYDIDSSDFPVGSPERAAIEQAIAQWNDNTVIRLVPRLDEWDFIVFEDTGTTCASGVGRRAGRQTVTCDLEGVGFSAVSLMHEIGHLVGFHHEQQRPDRNSFVSVGSTSDSVNCGVKNGERLLTDYDCDSIMHYPASGCGGISPIASGCSGIGQTVRLSGRDVWGASLLYEVPMHSVVVWEDDSDGDVLFDIHASGFAENGRRCCGPLRVHQLMANQQRTPEVGMAGNRNMVFVWADDRDGNGFFQIKMRGFGANGRQHFSQRTVNVHSAGQQIAPHVAVANDGRFVVVWQDDTDKNGIFQIKARGFESNGSERFSQRTVNTHPRGQQTAPRVAIAPDGFFVGVWEDDADGNRFTNIRMRGFQSDGTERWSERQVNVRSSGQQRRPQIAMGPFGDFVVVWEDDADKNGFFQIRMRAFNSDGNEKFSERTVNVVARGQQLEPDVAVDDVFRPVVVWADDRDKNGFFQIRMRGFESDGNERLSERPVNTDRDGQQRRPGIAMEANGRFTVAWEDDADNDGRAEDILVRGFSTNGEELFATRQVSNIPGGHKGRPRVTARAMDLLDLFNPF
ncbi:MAG: M12 family metallopeptidase [Acidobacteriota bacterium]